MIGLPVGFESKTTPVFSLVSNTNVISVWTGHTVFNPSAGTIIVDLEKEKVTAGFFYLLNLAADHRILVAEEPFRQERPLTFTEIAYELTEKAKPTDALLSFPPD